MTNQISAALAEQRNESNLLEACGLNRTERAILIYLLEQKRSTAGLIAKRTGIKRPTVYSALVNLEMQGLVVKQKLRGSVYFNAVNVSAIPVILKNRARDKFQIVEAAAKLLESQLPDFSNTGQHTLAGYEITVLESIDAINGVMENALSSGNYCGIFNPETALATPRDREMVIRYLRKTSRERTKIREIAVTGPRCDWYKKLIDNPNHQLKEIAEDQTIPIDFILVDNTALITNYAQDATSAIMLKHTAFSSFMRIMFDTLWKSLP